MKGVAFFIMVMLCGVTSCDATASDIEGGDFVESYMGHLETQTVYMLCYEKQFQYLNDNNDLYGLVNLMMATRKIDENSKDCLDGSFAADREFSIVGKVPQ